MICKQIFFSLPGGFSPSKSTGYYLGQNPAKALDIGKNLCLAVQLAMPFHGGGAQDRFFRYFYSSAQGRFLFLRYKKN